MALVNGNKTIRAGTNDYVNWELLDGNLSVPGAGITKAKLVLRETKTKETKVFSTDDAVQKLYITDTENLKIQLRPAVDDFPIAGSWKIYILIYDDVGIHSFPEDTEYDFKVREQF